MATARRAGQQIAAVTHRAPRADAQRNRDLIFAAAKICFAEPGAGSGMEDIARRAGVGVGTLYRAFGSRLGLAEALYQEMLEELAGAATRLVKDGDPYEALATWLRAYVGQLQSKRAMLGELQPMLDRNPGMVEDARKRAAEALALVLEPAQKRHQVRADLLPADLMQLVSGMMGSGLAEPGRAELLLGIILDGIRIGPARASN